MRNGYLSQYFKSVMAKKINANEISFQVFYQQQNNEIEAMKKLLGTVPCKYCARFLYLNDESVKVTEDGFLIWYTVQSNCSIGVEYRLSFSNNSIFESASEDDILFICLKPDKTAIVVIAADNSIIAAQLCWLFGVDAKARFAVSDNFNSADNRLEYASKRILEQIGVEIEEQDSSYLDAMLSRFGEKLPEAREFSAYARSTLSGYDPRENADAVLLAWLDREETLFRTLEKYLIQERLKSGFESVDDFISYSLSVQNRRKSRAGQALENHFEAILQMLGIRYDRTEISENRSQPEFIFPGFIQYRNPEFPTEQITMLRAKSTCKDRLYQIIEETDRIGYKYLLTLEAAISTHQTDEMQGKHLQLVIPEAIHKSYTPAQQAWLMNVKEFLSLVISRQGI